MELGIIRLAGPSVVSCFHTCQQLQAVFSKMFPYLCQVMHLKYHYVVSVTVYCKAYSCSVSKRQINPLTISSIV
jgi:hypothetical protein